MFRSRCTVKTQFAKATNFISCVQDKWKCLTQHSRNSTRYTTHPYMFNYEKREISLSPNIVCCCDYYGYCGLAEDTEIQIQPNFVVHGLDTTRDGVSFNISFVVVVPSFKLLLCIKYYKSKLIALGWFLSFTDFNTATTAITIHPPPPAHIHPTNLCARLCQTDYTNNVFGHIGRGVTASVFIVPLI